MGDRLPNGLVFDQTMSYLYTTARTLGRDFGNLGSAEGAEAFMAWVREPASPAQPVSRYVVQRVIHERPDVTAAFPDFDGEDACGFVSWWQTSGRLEMNLPDELLRPMPARNGRATKSEVSSPVPAPAALAASVAPIAHGAPSAVHPASPPTAATDDRTAERARASDGGLLGVRVTGYLSHILGLGSAARGYARALGAAGVAITTVSVPLDHLQLPGELSSEYGRHSYDDVIHAEGHGFELVCVNADELPEVINRLGEDFFQGRRIGVWGWETNSIPSRWKNAFDLLDEIWVYSQFMARNLGAVAPVPVVALPPPVEVPLRQPEPMRLGVPSGFMFLFVFDYLSTIQRKNPVGLIEAFKRAFTPGEGPHLLVKTLNAPLRPLAEEEVLWATEDRPDIRVIDRSLSAQERDSLMMSCDCYVSLHRSEGFGLTLAEAMGLGKPVIGTGYSGNVDFMNPDNSFLVDYDLTLVGPDCEIYPADGEWADPSIDHAAELMRRVYEQPEDAARVGARARDDVARMLSPQATGAAMARRLRELSERLAPHPAN